MTTPASLSLSSPASRSDPLHARSAPDAQHHFEIRAVDAPPGAEVTGLDLAQPPGVQDCACPQRAHLDHHVLVLRDQRITPDRQVAFSRRLGTPDHLRRRHYRTTIEGSVPH